MKDMHSGILLVAAIGAATLSADAASAGIDLVGYDAAELVIAIGVGGIAFSGANRIDFQLLDSDDGVTFAPVDQRDVLGASAVAGGVVKSLVAAHPAASVHRFGYVGGKRFVQVKVDFSGDHSGGGTPIAAMLMKGRGFNQPEANQG